MAKNGYTASISQGDASMTEDKVPEGKAKGGYARREALSSGERSRIAKLAAAGRWKNPVMLATHGSEDHPLRIGDIEIPCYVLKDGRRVLQQTGVIQSLNMSHGGSYSKGGDRLAKFVTQDRLKGLVSNDLVDRTARPIRFKTPSASLAYGYEATILADLCEAILAARREGRLQKQQMHIADRAEILLRGFARVGIVALVDEATGYEKDRIAGSLARILEAFIAKELQPWIKTFPAEYYEQLFRLRGLPYSADSVKRPQYFGCLTNDIVYKRIAPGVLNELKRVTVKNESGRPKQRYFQYLTTNVGYPTLREHLGAVVATMQLSGDYKDFMEKLDRIRPKFANVGETLALPFNYEQEKDDGKSL